MRVKVVRDCEHLVSHILQKVKLLIISGFSVVLSNSSSPVLINIRSDFGVEVPLIDEVVFIRNISDRTLPLLGVRGECLVYTLKQW